MDIIKRAFEELTLYELFEIVRARFDVFVGEQHILEPEYDDIDYRSIHLFIRDQGKVIAYARLFREDTPGEWHLGRMLTTRRKQGLGAAIIRAAVDYVREQGDSRIVLHSQLQARGFYERQGFSARSGVFEEAGIPHILMAIDVDG